MKLSLNPNRYRQGVVLWVIIIIFVIFVVIIAGIAVTMIKAATRIVPPKRDPDGNSYVPGMGTSSRGGLVVGYVPGSSQFDYQPVQTNMPTGSWSMMILASDSPAYFDWTNCILVTNYPDWDSFTNGCENLTISNLMQIDPAFATNAPCRFYKPVVQQW
jgi:hypothetical protein